MEKQEDPWYAKGLRFGCTGCGKCCTGFPGYVWLSGKEILTIAKFLKLPPETFLQQYTRSIYSRISLKEDPKNYDCVFFKDKRCLIYPVRPMQCQTYPFWEDLIACKKAWEEAKKSCEGIDHPKAPLIDREEIDKQRKRYLEEYPF